nr:HNH endonuclease [Brucella anthropi]
MRQDVDTSILRDILHYDADTGILFWKQRPSKYFSDTPTRNKEGHAKWWNGRFAGKRACKSDGHRGYLRVSIFREEYPAHRVIWAMVHGAWPTKSIDHIDGDKANNRTSNLREATTAENNKNRAPHGKSQYRGVSWRTRQNCWVSAIKTDGKVSFLGCFKEEIEAAKAYDRAAIIQHGEFARTNFPKADYEARILSALEPSAARELALEEAAQVAEMFPECDLLNVNGNEVSPAVNDAFKRGAFAQGKAIAAAIRTLSSPEHADDLAVDRFAIAMKQKLAKKREEGRGGWENKDECSAEYLSYLLIQHIWKGDPVDIANLAMMLHQRGERVVIDSETSFIIPDHADAGKVEGHGLPQDVINLVIAAREVWEEADTLSYYHTDEEFSQRVKALDKALEAFSERVPYENEPSAPASDGAE